MNRNIFRIVTILVLGFGIIFFMNNFKAFTMPDTVRAFGDLTVDFHVPSGTPLFAVSNAKPGDSISKQVDVHNGGTVSRFVVVRGNRSGGNGSDPKIESVLDITIKDGNTSIYGNGSSTGNKKLQDFFTESSDTNGGIHLSSVSTNSQKTYTFVVSFPQSAGNEFQQKTVVFDLVFGEFVANTIVINKVFYAVDPLHGFDSLKDRFGATTVSGKVVKQACGTNPTAQCILNLQKNNEWVELYNPTNKEVSINGWSLTDNSGKTIFAIGDKVKAGGFVLITQNNTTWNFWNPVLALKIQTTSPIGDGLDNTGDYLVLRDNNGKEIDRMSWGSDTSGFTPAATNPSVSLGSATARLAPGFDTNQASDWTVQNPPKPGF